MTVRGHSSTIITGAVNAFLLPQVRSSRPHGGVYCEGYRVDPPLPHILRPLFRQSLFPVSLPLPTPLTVAVHSCAYTNSCIAFSMSPIQYYAKRVAQSSVLYRISSKHTHGLCNLQKCGHGMQPGRTGRCDFYRNSITGSAKESFNCAIKCRLSTFLGNSLTTYDRSA